MQTRDIPHVIFTTRRTTCIQISGSFTEVPPFFFSLLFDLYLNQSSLKLLEVFADCSCIAWNTIHSPIHSIPINDCSSEGRIEIL